MSNNQAVNDNYYFLTLGRITTFSFLVSAIGVYGSINLLSSPGSEYMDSASMLLAVYLNLIIVGLYEIQRTDIFRMLNDCNITNKIAFAFFALLAFFSKALSDVTINSLFGVDPSVFYYTSSIFSFL